MTNDDTTNTISGTVQGNAVQAGTIDAVHAPAVTVSQKASTITNFFGPVVARHATFGIRYDAPNSGRSSTVSPPTDHDIN